MTHTPRHRHFVAVPAFMLFLGLASVIHAVVLAEAEEERFTEGVHTVSANTEKRTILLPGYASVTLEPHAKVKVEREGKSIRVVQGEVLLESPGAMSVLIYSSSAEVLASRVYVVADAASTTIIPITSPVLIASESTTSILLPGKQMRFSPDNKHQEFPVPHTWGADFVGFGEVRASEVSNDLDVLAAAFRDTRDVRTILALTRDSSATLPFLASLILLPTTGAGDVPSQSALRDTLFSDASSDLAVATVPLLLLRSPFQVSDAVLSSWLQSALRSAATDPIASADFLERIAVLPKHLSDAGYPKQAKLWEEALRSVLTVTSSLLPGDRRIALRALFDTVDEFAVQQSSEVSLAEQNVEKPKTSYTQKELLSKGRNLLLMHEAMVGSETDVSIDPEDDQSVRIENFFIAENGRDVRYSCVYTPGTNRISRIEREGVLLPNSLTPEQFFH